MRIVGNDIASFQGDINYDIYKNNTNFVIMKATEGVGFKDPKLTRNQSEARRLGIPLGYYHFAKPDLGNAPEKEAQWFLDQIGELREGEVLVLDYEVSKVQAQVAWCKAWLDYVFSKTGVRPLIYMSESYVTGLNWKIVSDAGYGLWIAKYLFNPTPDANYNTGVWPFAAIYQWSSSQHVPGILNGTGNVDANVFYGDQETFKKYGYKKVAPPAPPQNWEEEYKKQLARANDFESKYNAANTQVASLQSKIDNAKRDLA